MARQEQISPVYKHLLLVATLSTIGVSALWFGLTWNYGLNIADEGFYWYGAQRTFQGDVPLRDFMAYDIGRYYWTAAFMWLMDSDGLFAARLSAAVYQTLGIIMGVFTCLLAWPRRGVAGWIFAIIAACIFNIWCQPYYKSYDHAASLVVVTLLVLMLKTTKPTAWLFAGVCLGMAAIMGRNHGVYGALASFFIVALLSIKSKNIAGYSRLYFSFCLGVIIGFSPTFIMMIAVDGFMAAFIDSLVLMFKYGSTNIPMPIPWPWTTWKTYQGLGFVLSEIKLMADIGFVAMPLFIVMAVLALAFNRFDYSDDRKKVIIAAIAAAIPYAHYAFARADLFHLSLGILPTLVALIASCTLIGEFLSLIAVIGLALLSINTFMMERPYLYSKLNGENFTPYAIDGETFFIGKNLARKLDIIKDFLKESRGSPEASFLGMPYMITVHAILREKMAIWEIYPVIPRDMDLQLKEISRLEAHPPKYIFMENFALDGNERFRYSNSHPEVYNWLTSKYRLLGDLDRSEVPNSGIKIYAR